MKLKKFIRFTLSGLGWFKINSLRKLLITYADGNAAGKMAVYSIPSFKKYAGLHGYDFKVIEKYNNKPPAWQKVYAMQDYLHFYDYVLWIDVDAIIVKFDKDIADVFNYAKGFQAIPCEPFEPNMGVWLMRKCDRSFNFLKDLIAISAYFYDPCWEQTAAYYLLGYKGDSGNMDYIRETVLLGEKWNNVDRGRVPRSETIIVHFAGRSAEDKIEGMREIAEAGMPII